MTVEIALNPEFNTGVSDAESMPMHKKQRKN